MNYSTEEVKTMVEYINETDYEPSDWENDFIESILKWKGGLTSKQSEILLRIYEKATGG